MLYGTLLRTTKAAVALENAAQQEFSFNMKKKSTTINKIGMGKKNMSLKN
jgi:hypothetical protein